MGMMSSHHDASFVQAAYIDRLGPSDAIQVGRLARPAMGPGQVRINVRVVAANPVDTYVRSGRFPTAVSFPFVIGRDLVGEIVEAADDVADFAVGDRVWCNSLGYDGRQGSFAEQVVAPADRVFPLPSGVDIHTAVAYLHPGTTAWLGLVREASLASNTSVLIGGGAGNVGAAAVDLAVALGARVVATARPADHDRARQLGADAVFDYEDPHLSTKLRAVAPDGFDVVWNSSGHHDLAQEIEATADGGLVLVTAAADPSVALPLRDLYLRDIRVAGFVLSRATLHDLQEAAQTVNERLRSATPVRVAEVLPLRAAADAHRRIEAGSVRGRLVIRMT